MSPFELERAIKLAWIFMPYATERRLEIDQKGGRFAHYTSAENAISILQSKEIWMRNALCIADYMEVQHGHQLLVEFFTQEDKRKAFCAAVDFYHERLGTETLKLFDRWWQTIRFATYISSVSEHYDSEDTHGRLSMWRAFSRSTSRAAIVFKPPPLGSAEELNVLLSPAAYFDYGNVETQMRKVIQNIRDNVAILQTLARDETKVRIFFMLVVPAVTLKD